MDKKEGEESTNSSNNNSSSPSNSNTSTSPGTKRKKSKVGKHSLGRKTGALTKKASEQDLSGAAGELFTSSGSTFTPPQTPPPPLPEGAVVASPNSIRVNPPSRRDTPKLDSVSDPTTPTFPSPGGVVGGAEEFYSPSRKKSGRNFRKNDAPNFQIFQRKENDSHNIYNFLKSEANNNNNTNLSQSTDESKRGRSWALGDETEQMLFLVDRTKNIENNPQHTYLPGLSNINGKNVPTYFVYLFVFFYVIIIS